MSDVVGIIPARLASSRFPNKVLAAETGKPLIQHVWESTRRARSLSRVVIAVDDERVLAAARAFGAEAVMTDVAHPNGSSRLAQAARLLNLAPDALVVNVQGDEPEIEAGVVDAAVEIARSSGADVATIASPFAAGEDPTNPNIVKVVVGRNARALYFSRSLIPHPREGGIRAAPLKHVGLYVYRAAFLATYVTLPATPLEQTEMLEQLRVLEHGHSIAVAVRDVRAQGIDTPEQYAAFVARHRAALR